jgi:hypothetical protein
MSFLLFPERNRHSPPQHTKTQPERFCCSVASADSTGTQLNSLYSFLHHLEAFTDVGDGVFGLLLILQREAALEVRLF